MVKLTPPLGWNSWNTFGANISEELIKQTADCMVESGLLAAGHADHAAVLIVLKRTRRK